MEKPLWSTSIICKNEEQSIQKLLDSLKEYISLGGEVIVIDTGSKDKTIEILKNNGFRTLVERDIEIELQKFNLPSVEGTPLGESMLFYEEVGSKFNVEIDEYMAEKINYNFSKGGETLVELDLLSVGDKYDKKYVFDFGKARRYAESKCSDSFQWIMSVDCDEVFSGLDINFLNHIIRTGDVQQLNFNFRYRSPDGDITSSTTRDKFYNRDYGTWKWVVHEQVKPRDGKNVRTCTVSDSTLSLDHYQHSAEHRSNYLLAMCIDVINDPNDQHVHWLGREMMYQKFYNSAIHLLKKHLKTYNKAWSGEKCMSCIYIGDCYLELCKQNTNKLVQDINSRSLVKNNSSFTGDFSKLDDGDLVKFSNIDYDGKKALGWYFRAIHYEPNFREPLMKLVEFYYQKRQYHFAINFIESTLKINKVQENYMNDRSCYSSKPYILYYMSLLNIGDKEKACDIYIKASELFPSDVEIQNHNTLFT